MKNDINSTVEKGTIFEKKVFLIVKKLLESGSFLYLPNSSKIFHQKEYYSKDRQSNIKVDISIEVYLPDAKDWSTLCIIECKNYSGKVPIGDIEEFKGKLDQISGKNIKGIFCTSNSFPESVLNYSKSNGLGLCRIVDDKSIRWDVYNEFYTPITWDKIAILKDDVKKCLLEEEYIANTNFIFSFFNGQYYFNFASYFVEAFGYSNRPNITNIELYDLINDKANREIKVKYLSFKEIENITKRIISEIQSKQLNIPGEIALVNIISYVKNNYGFSVEERSELDISPRGYSVLGKIDFNLKVLYIGKDLNIKDGKGRFTFLHEIGHLVLHSGYFVTDYKSEHSDEEDDEVAKYISSKMQKRIEIQANEFASTLLMPKESIDKVVNEFIMEYEIKDKGTGLIYVDNQECNRFNYNIITGRIMKIYNVSKRAATNRLKRLGYLRFGKINNPEKYLTPASTL